MTSLLLLAVLAVPAPKSDHAAEAARWAQHARDVTIIRDGQLRDVYFYRSQLVGHTERTYHPGE